MPTIKPRVQVTLEPSTHDVIERFATLQNRTRGAVISDLLNSIAPSLARSVALLEAAQEAPRSVKAGLRSVIDDMHSELLSITGDASVALKQFEALFDGANGDAPGVSTPVSVTRGSGTDSPPPRKRSKQPIKGSKSGVSKG